MSSNAKTLAACLHSLVHQHGDTNDMHQLMHACRALASVIIQALRHHSPSDIASWISWRLRTSQRPDHRPVNNLNRDYLIQQINDVRRIRNLSRCKKRNVSKLDPYKAELLALRRSGASWSDLRGWLHRYPRIKADRSTVIRRVSKWLEEDGRTQA